MKKWAILVLAGCAHAGNHEHATPQAQAVKFDNLGSWHHAISCKPEAQAWFDQGLRLVYGFNHDESIRSFTEAAHQDPDCAMAYWGVAYANGPHINNPSLDPDHAKAAWEAVQKAQAAKTATPVEKEWVAAVAQRYAADPKADRAALDKAYADAMRALMKAHPDDSDAAALFAESVMDLHPWEMWRNDGTPYEWTPEVVAALEAALAKAPDNPGANHFYIHALEESKQPEKAMQSADRLQTLAPGAGHLVHMPGHIYMRVGRYEDAAEANRKAIKVDDEYVKKQPAQAFYLMYKAHNFQFLWAAAMMEGRSAEAIQATKDMIGTVPPPMMDMMGDMLIIETSTGFALARFGKWDEVLAQPLPPEKHPINNALGHYLRGVALARKGQIEEALKERDAVSTAAGKVDDKAMVGQSSAKTVMQIADKMLAGEIAAAAKQTDEAIRLLDEAAKLEDTLHYDEPPDWLIPVRHTLGAVLLQAGRAKQAEKVYREDLERNPSNGWSLFGLSESLRRQNHKTEAAQAEQEFQKAWQHADVKITSSRL